MTRRQVQPSRKMPATALDKSLVYAAVLAVVERSRVALGYVPDAVKACGIPVERAKVALLQLDRDQAIELRPESGVGLLSVEDAALCPRGINNVVLSYCAVLDKLGE